VVVPVVKTFVAVVVVKAKAYRQSSNWKWFVSIFYEKKRIKEGLQKLSRKVEKIN
jgi:hypothetical protein